MRVDQSAAALGRGVPAKLLAGDNVERVSLPEDAAHRALEVKAGSVPRYPPPLDR